MPDKQIDADLSKTFATMSFVCSCMVVYLHTGHAVARDGVVLVVLHRILHTLCGVAIPWFFLASGFFLSKHIGEDDWWRTAVKKRVKTLLIPFWIWGVLIWSVYVVIALLIKHFGAQYQGVDALEWLSARGISRVLGIDPFGNMPTMWFLRTLFIFVCLAPLIVRFNRIFIGLSFISYLLLVLFQNTIDKDTLYVLEYLFSLRGVLYFSLGIWLNRNVINVTSHAKMTVIVSGIVTLCANAVLQIKGFDYSWLEALMVPAIMLCVFELSRHISLPRKLLAMSFPIYVSHVGIAFTLSGLWAFVFCAHKVDFGPSLLKFLISLLAPIGLATLLNRKAPKVATIVYGGRG